MKAYKFVPLKYAEDFAAGKMRISPADMMRSYDGFDDGRSDPLELIVEGSIPGGSMLINSSTNPVLSRFVVSLDSQRVPQEIELIATGDTFRIIDNALIFCASTEISPDLVRLMAEKFDSRAIFEISDFNEFADLISSEVFSPEVSYRADSIVYRDEVEGGLLAFQPVDPFRKRKKFSWQKEVRIVWKVEDVDEPFNVRVDSVVGLIRRVE